MQDSDSELNKSDIEILLQSSSDQENFKQTPKSRKERFVAKESTKYPKLEQSQQEEMYPQIKKVEYSNIYAQDDPKSKNKPKKLDQTIITPELEKFKEKGLKHLKTYKYNLDELMELQAENPILAYSLVTSMMTQPPSQNQVKMSDQILQEMKISLKQSDHNLPLIALHNFLADSQSQVIFCPNSTVNTQLSLMLLATNFMSKRQIYVEHYKSPKGFSFDELSINKRKTRRFVKSFKAKMAKKYKISPQHIFVHSISQGSLVVEWELTDPAGFPYDQPRLKIHKYFKFYRLSPQDFDPQGNVQYKDKKEIQFRGNLPYYLPRNAKRYGLKVKGRYNRGNNDWLQTGINAGEWAIAFHGCRPMENSQNNNGKVIKRLNSIMQGLKTGEMLKAGFRNVYQGKNCINQPSQKVPNGVYLSPHLATATSFAQKVKVEGKEYRLIFQCRINPKKNFICQDKQHYWIVKDSEDIRPYGILLIKEENVNNVIQQTDASGFGIPHQDEVFTWEAYLPFMMTE